MTSTPPPAPVESPTLRTSHSPSIPLPSPPNPAVNHTSEIPNMLADDPEHLLRGGAGRVAQSGLEGGGMQELEGLGDGQGDVDGDGRKRQRKRRKSPITKSGGPGDGQEDVNNDNTLIKSGAGSKKKRGKNLVVEQKQRNTPITKVVTSPGVNVLMSSTMLKRAVSLANSTRRARTTGSAEILPTQQAQVCPTLQDLSPSTRAANSHASTRRRRKLISSIWREAMPIYKDRRLVEGICNYCGQVFPASRDTGTSHILRHLKVTAIWTRDAGRMSFPVVLASLGNAFFWGKYGRLEGQIIVQKTNEWGIYSPMVQVVVYLVLRRNELSQIWFEEIPQFFHRIPQFFHQIPQSLKNGYDYLRRDEEESDDD